jgi:myosin heavy subunit
MSCSGGDPPNNPIEELKERVRICEMKIQELEQQLKQCKKEHEEEKKELKRKLENVNKEKDLLKKLIQEKKSIEKSFNAQMSLMKKEFNGTMKELIGEMNSMKEESKEKDTRMEEESKEKDTQMKKMKADIIYFSNKSNANEAKVSNISKRIEELEKSRGLLYIGQLCANVQEDIYGYVFPDNYQGANYSWYRQPHVKDIETNIDELYEDENENLEAKGKWTDLQIKIGWDPDLVGVMEGLMKERNKEAHPYPLDDDELEKIANELPGEKQQIVKKIIQISKKLTALCVPFTN